MKQAELFDHVLESYGATPVSASMSNAALYAKLSDRADIDPVEWGRTVPIGQAGASHSPLKRQVRWYQQTLRSLGLLERDPASGRGHWRLTPQGRKRLTPAPAGRALVAFSTDLGVALWASAGDVMASIDVPITLLLSSLPYPLARPRSYGNPTAAEYVDWVCVLLEPVVERMDAGGSICLNIGNDVFESKVPARSLYAERMVLALCDRLGLWLMDRLCWHNPSKPPGPLQWASLSRQQLNGKHELIYWLTNDPQRVRSDNRRVLRPHTAQHLALIQRGGEKRSTNYGDGAHRVRAGSYGSPTAGSIPGNVLEIAHRCVDKERARQSALAQGLPTHSAAMPLTLAKFLIEFLTEPGDLVMDPCGGWMTTGKAAEITGRRWISTELMGEYVLGAANRFRDAAGFQCFGSFHGHESRLQST